MCPTEKAWNTWKYANVPSQDNNLTFTYKFILRMDEQCFRLKNQKTEDGKQMRERFESRKKEVKKRLLEKFHLKVDCVEAGKGSTNNGPTARKLFSNPKEFAGK